MERNYSLTAASAFVKAEELRLRTAFHEAGHAAAIHIRNRQKQLPPVFFEIQVKHPSTNNGEFCAKVVDGNLTQNLPIAVIESFSFLTADEQHSCQRAYEADIVNLLSGPLAEAKHVLISDGEPFNINLIDINALRFYGGHSDLERAQYYLESFITSKILREQKLSELLIQAYEFVDDFRYWNCIQNLAQFILDSRQEIITCDEAINVFEQTLTAPPNIHWPRNISHAGR